MINELSLMTIHLSLMINSAFLQEWLSIGSDSAVNGGVQERSAISAAQSGIGEEK